MTPYQIGWLAGIVDGEGHLGIYWAGKISIHPRLCVKMTCEDTISHLKDMSGVGTFKQVCEPKGNHKAQWEWYVGALKDIEAVLSSIYPHLVTKRRAARHLLNMCVIWRTRRNYRGIPLSFKKKLHAKMLEINSGDHKKAG